MARKSFDDMTEEEFEAEMRADGERGEGFFINGERGEPKQPIVDGAPVILIMPDGSERRFMAGTWSVTPFGTFISQIECAEPPSPEERERWLADFRAMYPSA